MFDVGLLLTDIGFGILQLAYIDLVMSSTIVANFFVYALQTPSWLRIRIRIRLDPDSIGSVDPDPDSESGSGTRRAKMTHKSRNFFKSSCFEVLDGILRAVGFFCNLDVLYGGLGIGKL
jgi:hypothetical protein